MAVSLSVAEVKAADKEAGEIPAAAAPERGGGVIKGPACKGLQGDVEAIELPLLLEAIYRRYGYDFRHYAQQSLLRRLKKAMQQEEVKSLSALQDRVLHQTAAMARLLDAVSVETTAMFRDPALYRVIRQRIVPEWRQRPGPIRLWFAGSSTGEEVYSLAIILHEAELLGRARLYATDINQVALSRARAGIFPLRHMREFTTNYLASGGQAEFSRYYRARYDNIILRDFLRKNTVWAEHNLVTDSSFNEFHLIFCRNVMIYFDRSLQARVHRLLFDSLAEDGLLALGRGETIQFSPFEGRYAVVDLATKLYRKTGGGGGVGAGATG